MSLALLGIGIGTSLYNAYNQEKTNRDNQKKADRDYLQSRKDTLADFDRVNSYNSPLQQMTRLRQAGLNPNLVYGKGADNTASTINSPKKTSPDIQPVPFDSDKISTALQLGTQLKFQQEQTDNLVTQRELMEKEKSLKDATTAKIAQDTATSKFQLEQSQRLKDIVVEKSILDNEQTRQNTQYTKSSMSIAQSDLELRKMQNSSNIAKTTQDIIASRMAVTRDKKQLENLEIQMANAKQANEMNELDLRLKRIGLNPTDPTYQRVLTQALQEGWSLFKKSDTYKKYFGN